MPKCLARLDEVEFVDSMQNLAAEHMAIESETAKIHNLAMRLLATSFYFEVDKVQHNAHNSSKIIGTFSCSLRLLWLTIDRPHVLSLRG